jgi:hypothetical protein
MNRNCCHVVRQYLLQALAFLLVATFCSQMGAEGKPNEAIIRRIAWSERELIANLKPFVFEVYAEHKDENGRVVGDYFTGGWAEIGDDGVVATEFPDTAETPRRKSRYLASGFVQMLFPDLAGVDPDNYTWNYRGEEILGDSRCWVFDLTPRNAKARGLFIGRLWAAQSDLGIVRFDGTYTHETRRSPYLHFVSSRAKSGPDGFWLPATVHVEEHDLARRMPGVQSLTARVNVWGYHRLAGQVSEATALRALPEDSLTVQDALSAVPEPHQWYQQIERIVTEWLQVAGLLAPVGKTEDELNGVVRKLLPRTGYRWPIKCRVLLTTTMEAFAIGDTIAISKGVLDSVRDEPSLAVVIATPLAHILLRHHIETKYFPDRLLGERVEVLRRLSFRRTEEETEAAAFMAVELLTGSSSYRSKLSDAASFLRGVAEACQQRPALFQPRFGEALLGCGRLTAISRLSELAPRDSKAILANSLGTRVVVDSSSGGTRLVHPQLEASPFGLIPMIPNPRDTAQEQREGPVLPPAPRQRRPALPALR